MSVSCRFLPIFRELQKIQEKQIKNQHTGSFQSPEGGSGGPPATQAARWRLGGVAHLWRPPSAYITSSLRKPSDRPRIVNFLYVPPPPRFQDREHQKTSSRHPGEGRI